MRKPNVILATILGFLLIIAVPLITLGANPSDVSQGAHGLIRAHIYGDSSYVGQWGYGNLILEFDDTDFAVTSTFDATDSKWIIDLSDSISASIWVDDPITGSGTVGDPLDIASTIAGYGLSMTTNFIDVNTGTGLYIDGSDNVTVGWNDGAGHTLTFDSDTLAADATYTWPDLPVANGYLFTIDTDGSMATVDSDTISAAATLDTAYEAGESIEIDGDGPVENHFLQGTGTARTYESIDVGNYLTVNDDAAGGGTNVINLWHFDDDSASDNDYFFYAMAGETSPGLIAYLNASGVLSAAEIALSGGGAVGEDFVVNKDGVATGDFRVESDNNTNMLFVDASADRVGINDETPDWTLDVVGNIGADDSVYILEQADADADITGYGQWWVDNTTPCIPMFTDDAGTDFQLNATDDDGGYQIQFYLDGSFTGAGTTALTFDTGFPVPTTGEISKAGCYVANWGQNGTVDTVTVKVYYGVPGSLSSFQDNLTYDSGLALENIAPGSSANVTGGSHIIKVEVIVTEDTVERIPDDLTDISVTVWIEE